jgi:DNA-directed RNA polymerase subunit K/omega
MGDEAEDYTIESNDEEEEEEDLEDDIYPDTSEAPVVKRRMTGASRTTLPRMTRYEESRVLETRSLQIQAGSSVGVIVKSIHTLNIAGQELEEERCPLFIERPDGSGKGSDLWHTNELEMVFAGNQPKTPIQSIMDMSFEQIIGPHVVWPKITANKQKPREEMPTPPPKPINKKVITPNKSKTKVKKSSS